MTTTLILIRHGETSWNAIKRIQGFTDIPLNEVGLRQADDLGERFAALVSAPAPAPASATAQAEASSESRVDRIIAELFEADGGPSLDEKPISVVYTSDLERAQQTAAPLSKALGLTPVLTESVRERNYGLFEGMNPDEIAERHPELFAHWQSRDPDFRPGPGESQRMFHHRVVDALREIASKHRGERVVVVAHGGVLDNARRYAQSLPLEQKRDYLLLNASINILVFNESDARVVSWGDVAHLHADDEAQDDTRPERVPDTRVV